ASRQQRTHPDETGSVPTHGDCSGDARDSVPVAPDADIARPAHTPSVTLPVPHNTLRAPTVLAEAEARHLFVDTECGPGYRRVLPPGPYSLSWRSTPPPEKAVTSTRAEGAPACPVASAAILDLS